MQESDRGGSVMPRKHWKGLEERRLGEANRGFREPGSHTGYKQMNKTPLLVILAARSLSWMTPRRASGREVTIELPTTNVGGQTTWPVSLSPTTSHDDASY